MTKIVLLAVAAAWAAVLLPPLLRNRSENRPGSSVSDFNRQLSSLQRSVPTRGLTPMRSIARPLAQSPMSRPAAPGRPGQMYRSGLSVAGSGRPQQGPAPVRRVHGEPGMTRVHGESQHRQAQVHRGMSARSELRRRRANVLFVLLITTVTTLFLAATTHTSFMMYAFALSFLSLCGYCYKLVQLKQYEQQQNTFHDSTWFRAA
jgi:hypothetical protein